MAQVEGTFGFSVEPLRKISTYLGRWPIALLAIAVLAAAVLVPAIDVPGLWEPTERAVSDRIAPPLPIEKQLAEAKQKAAAAQAQQPPQVKPPEDSCKRVAPEDAVARSLTNRSIKWGRDHLGDDDAGRKLPLALFGLLTVLATAGIAMRTANARAGLVTAIVLLSMPLLVLQARMLTSEIGTACGGALVVYGFLSLRRVRDLIIGPHRAGPLVLAAVDLSVGLVSLAGGVVIGFASGGAMLGLLVPIGAVAAAGKLGLPFVCDAGKLVYNVALRVGGRRWRLGKQPLAYSGESYGFAFLALLAAAALVALLAYQMYDLKPPYPGIQPPARQVLGHAIVPEGCWSWALGGIWRPEDDLRFAMDSSMEQIAYGTFPWGIVGPIAMLLLLRDDDPKRRLVGALTLAWAGGAWIATEAFQRKVGVTIYAGFPALAIAIGVWIDGVLERRARGEASAMPAGALLLGLFILLAVLDLGKDLQGFPEKLTSLLSGVDTIQYPGESRLLFLKTKLWVLALGTSAAFAVAMTMMLWRPGDSPTAVLLRRVSAWAAAAALAASIVIAAFWAFAWHPRIAESLSSKAMFETYKELRGSGDQLVIMGELGHAPLAYADATPEKAPSREQVVTALKRPNRVFAIAPVSELCSIHREMGDKPYFVIDDRNTRNLLYSNQVKGTTDRNPLRDLIVHAEPKTIPKRPKGRVVWDNRIELLGWDIPKKVQRGDTFEVTLYYKILQSVGANWTTIMHFDGAIRFSGDHKPINDRCPTSTWQLGDYIIDRTTVVAGGAGHPLGTYELWIGFFTGTAPNYKNMPVSLVPDDMRDKNPTDRVKIATVILD